MHLEHLSLKNFRNYTRLEMPLPKGNIVLHGQNAQGKTSFLEAIYYLATSNSPYATTDRQLLNWRTEREALPFAQVSADVIGANRQMSRLTITLVREDPNTPQERFKKEIRLNNVTRRRVDILGKIAVVMFLPQDLSLIEGAPNDRRRYINTTLNQVDGAYTEALTSFEKVLLQRNALLKRIGAGLAGESELEYWDEQLAATAAIIIASRQHFLREIELKAAQIYRELTGNREDLKLAYVPSFEPTAENNGQRSFSLLGLDLHRQVDPSQISIQYQAQLLKCRPEEIERGLTLLGPQRDEIRFLVNERDLGHYGSRGQARTAVLALKLAELAWISEQIGESPLLLLDEVASELDQARREFLLGHLQNSHQAILTTTEPNLLSESFLKTATLWRVEAGQIELPE